MPLVVTSEEYAQEFKLAVASADSDITKLLEVSQPYLDQWEQQLTHVDTEKELNYIILCRLLSPKEPEKALEMIAAWVKWAETSSSVKEELQYLFLQRIRRFKYSPTLARPVTIEYVIARDFKYGLHHFISYAYAKRQRDALDRAESTDTIELSYVPTIPDYLLMNNMKLNRWQSYLFQLMLDRDTSTSRAKLSHYKRSNLFHEEKKIWQLLNKKLSDS